jgi:hypothetical protein
VVQALVRCGGGLHETLAQFVHFPPTDSGLWTDEMVDHALAMLRCLFADASMTATSSVAAAGQRVSSHSDGNSRVAAAGGDGGGDDSDDESDRVGSGGGGGDGGGGEQPSRRGVPSPSPSATGVLGDQDYVRMFNRFPLAGLLAHVLRVSLVDDDTATDANRRGGGGGGGGGGGCGGGSAGESWQQATNSTSAPGWRTSSAPGPHSQLTTSMVFAFLDALLKVMCSCLDDPVKVCGEPSPLYYLMPTPTLPALLVTFAVEMWFFPTLAGRFTFWGTISCGPAREPSRGLLWSRF